MDIQRDDLGSPEIARKSRLAGFIIDCRTTDFAGARRVRKVNTWRVTDAATG